MKSIYKSSVHPEIRKKVGKLYTTKAVMHLMGVLRVHARALDIARR